VPGRAKEIKIQRISVLKIHPISKFGPSGKDFLMYGNETPVGLNRGHVSAGQGCHHGQVRCPGSNFDHIGIGPRVPCVGDGAKYIEISQEMLAQRLGCAQSMPPQ
jgi:hypothetical protein